MPPADVFDEYRQPIKLILSDLDGTLTTDEQAPLDCETLHAVRVLNDWAREGKAYPPLSIITGRPQPYLEAFARFVGTPLPSLFESGCGMYLPDQPLGNDYLFHPSLDEGAVLAAAAAFRSWAQRELVAALGAGLILGKRYAISYAPAPTSTIEELVAASRDLPAALSDLFFVTRSIGVLDVTPRPVDKGAGALWLLDYCRDTLGMDVTAANVVGVGDSYNDIPFFKVVGIPCAVANAADAAKAAASYVSGAPTGRGVAEIAARAVSLNRRLGYS